MLMYRQIDKERNKGELAKLHVGQKKFSCIFVSYAYTYVSAMEIELWFMNNIAMSALLITSF